MRYLLIDAYNVICATDSLREIMQGKLETARDQLAEAIGLDACGGEPFFGVADGEG